MPATTTSTAYYQAAASGPFIVKVAVAPATPTITGTAKVGSALTAHPGTWKPSGVALTYQWSASGQKISGATKTTLALTPAWVGKTITVTVSGAKSGLVTVARASKATAAVAKGTLSPAPVPTITGTAKVGSTLTAKPGTWGPAPVTLKYQWKANGTAISGATKTTLKLPSSVKGKKITVTVTGSKTGYISAIRTSKATTAVA